MPPSWRPHIDTSSKTFYTLALAGICAALIAILVVTGGGGGSTARGAPDGAKLFQAKFTPEQGLGPLFNRQSCSACHSQPTAGGVGPHGLATELRVGRLTKSGSFDAMVGRGGPFARKHSVSELGVACARTAGIPAGANVTSVRNTPPLFGAGLIDAIPDRVILAGAVAKPHGVSGRPNLVRGPDGRQDVGRFGWKEDTPTLESFVARAFRAELGVTSPLARRESLPRAGRPCPGESSTPDVGRAVVDAVTAYVAGLPAPRPKSSQPAGAAVFQAAGCAACHTPSLDSSAGEVHLYSDLLLHDMGPKLDDGVVQGSARGREWRTAPLWGLSDRTRFLHDGRADSLTAAILAHGGEAAAAQRRFRSLSPAKRRSLLRFLRSL